MSSKDERLRIARRALEAASNTNSFTIFDLEAEQKQHEQEMRRAIKGLNPKQIGALQEWSAFVRQHFDEIVQFPIVKEEGDEPDRSDFLAESSRELIPIVSNLRKTKVPTNLIAFQTAETIRPAYDNIHPSRSFHETHASQMYRYVQGHFREKGC